MTDRIYAGDVRSALAHYVDALERYGIDLGGRVEMDQGSPTYGRAWRIYVIPEGQSGHHRPPVGDDYLGWSAREAYENLTTRIRVIYDMAQLLNLQQHETTLDRTNAALAAAVEEQQS